MLTSDHLDRNDWIFAGILFSLLFAYIIGLPIDVMNIDAAQYAAMALEMKQSGSYLQVFEQGRDYLDKPPLLFWMSALALSVLGEYDWVYKLPSVLFTILAGYSLFRFALLYYTNLIARLSVVVFLSSQALFLMNNDIRTDNLLMGSCMLAIWQIASYVKGSSGKMALVWAGLGIGLGMLAKGPLGLIFPALAFFPVWFLQRKWSFIFKWEWLIVLIIAAIVISPMCYGLYTQFDLQPEKTVNGKTGVSGLYFYFWEQSFGRITGESTWSNNTGPFFFLHTYLWAFLPWVFFLIPALIVIWKKRTEQKEWYTLSGFLFIFLALSMSRYKLPHYIYLTLPLAAIFVARYLAEIGNSLKTRFIAITSYSYLILACIFSALIWVYIFPPGSLFTILIFVLPLISLLIIYSKLKNPVWKPVLLLAGISICVNIVMNAWFYPQLLQYQSSSMAMKYAKENGWQNENVRRWNTNASALHFYMGGPIELLEINIDSTSLPLLVYTDEDGKLQLENAFETELIQTFEDFAVTRLNPVFLRETSRSEATKPYYLIKLNSTSYE
jgi:4-amino-4-deoxy-L-arabinose transferase-like glycosyltransferase